MAKLKQIFPAFLLIIVVLSSIWLVYQQKDTQQTYNDYCLKCGYSNVTDNNGEIYGRLKIECDNKYIIGITSNPINCSLDKWGEKVCDSPLIPTGNSVICNLSEGKDV